MKCFKILVEAENCWLEVEGEKRLAGGFTTRGAIANSEDEAKSFVEMQLRKELRALISNIPQDPPIFKYQEISESTHKDVEDLPTAGFTWYLVGVQ